MCHCIGGNFNIHIEAWFDIEFHLLKMGDQVISEFTWLIRCLRKNRDCIYKLKITFEPVHEISNNVVCATCKASDQPARMRSLIRAFASLLSILWLLSY